MKTQRSDHTYFGLRFIATAAETDGKYFLCETTVPAGDAGPPLHFHQHEDEGFFLQKGQLTFLVEGKEVRLNQGEFINIEKGEKHTWRNESQEDAELVIVFSPAGIEEMFVALEQDMSQIKAIGVRFGTVFFLS